MAARFVVEITATAERDINAITDFIAEHRPAAARKWEQALIRQLRTLRSFPERGAVISEADLLGVRYRQLLHGDYRTIYRIAGNHVFVMREIHGAQQLAVAPLK